MSHLRLAAAQIECQAGDVDANLELHRRAIRQASDSGAAVVVFPELSLTDYVAKPDVSRLAMHRSAPHLLELARACVGISAAIGFIEVEDGKYYNSTAVLRDGRICSVHRKINLPGYGRLQENRYFWSGKDVTLHSLFEWKVSTLICADAWNPALPWLAALTDADLMLLPVASALDAVPEFDNPAGWDINLRHIAMTYGLPIVMCNHCGIRGNLRFWGGSRIMGPAGETLAIADTAPELIVADIDQTDVAAARRRLPTIRDASPELIAEQLQKILKQTKRFSDDCP